MMGDKNAMVQDTLGKLSGAPAGGGLMDAINGGKSAGDGTEGIKGKLDEIRPMVEAISDPSIKQQVMEELDKIGAILGGSSSLPPMPATPPAGLSL